MGEQSEPSQRILRVCSEDCTAECAQRHKEGCYDECTGVIRYTGCEDECGGRSVNGTSANRAPQTLMPGLVSPSGVTPPMRMAGLINEYSTPEPTPLAHSTPIRRDYYPTEFQLPPVPQTPIRRDYPTEFQLPPVPKTPIRRDYPTEFQLPPVPQTPQGVGQSAYRESPHQQTPTAFHRPRENLTGRTDNDYFYSLSSGAPTLVSPRPMSHPVSSTIETSYPSVDHMSPTTPVSSNQFTTIDGSYRSPTYSPGSQQTPRSNREFTAAFRDGSHQESSDHSVLGTPYRVVYRVVEPQPPDTNVSSGIPRTAPYKIYEWTYENQQPANSPFNQSGLSFLSHPGSPMHTSQRPVSAPSFRGYRDPKAESRTEWKNPLFKAPNGAEVLSLSNATLSREHQKKVEKEAPQNLRSSPPSAGQSNVEAEMSPEDCGQRNCPNAGMGKSDCCSRPEVPDQTKSENAPINETPTGPKRGGGGTGAEQDSESVGSHRSVDRARRKLNFEETN